MKPARVDEFLFLATNDSIPPAGDAMPAPDADLMEAILGRLDREFRGYSHFHLLGRHSQDIQRENPAWPIPATSLHLQFDASVPVDDCSVKVRVKFTDDGTELLSSASVLSGLRPMLLNGPPWRSGRLVLIALPKRF